MFFKFFFHFSTFIRKFSHLKSNCVYRRLPDFCVKLVRTKNIIIFHFCLFREGQVPPLCSLQPMSLGAHDCVLLGSMATQIRAKDSQSISAVDRSTTCSETGDTVVTSPHVTRGNLSMYVFIDTCLCREHLSFESGYVNVASVSVYQ